MTFTHIQMNVTMIICEGANSTHSHTENCFSKINVRVCRKSESEGHKHSNECFNSAGNLICEKTEADPHTHTDDCFKDIYILTCEEPTDETVHYHTSKCYYTDYVLVCDKTDHIHSEVCYKYNETNAEPAPTPNNVKGNLNNDTVNKVQAKTAAWEEIITPYDIKSNDKFMIVINDRALTVD